MHRRLDAWLRAVCRSPGRERHQPLLTPSSTLVSRTTAFAATLGILLLNQITMQGVGLLMSAAVPDGSLMTVCILVITWMIAYADLFMPLELIPGWIRWLGLINRMYSRGQPSRVAVPALSGFPGTPPPRPVSSHCVARWPATAMVYSSNMVLRQFFRPDSVFTCEPGSSAYEVCPAANITGECAGAGSARLAPQAHSADTGAGGARRERCFGAL